MSSVFLRLPTSELGNLIGGFKFKRSSRGECSMAIKRRKKKRENERTNNKISSFTLFKRCVGSDALICRLCPGHS